MRATCTRLRPMRTASVFIALIVGITASYAVASPANAHEAAKFRKERRHIKKRAMKQLGAPYVYGGSSSSGFDCSGLTSWTYNNHGGGLPRRAIDQFYLANNPKVKRIWQRSHLRKGDLVFHKTTSARVGHAGIYIGHGNFLSTTSSSGVRVQSIRDPYYWGPRWVGATRLPATRKRFG